MNQDNTVTFGHQLKVSECLWRSDRNRMYSTLTCSSEFEQSELNEFSLPLGKEDNATEH